MARDRGQLSGEVIPRGFRAAQLQNFTPQQQKLFQRSFGQVSPESYLSRLAGGDEGLFEQMEAPALKQFGQLQRGMASQFSGAGSFGARRSSGFQNQQSQAAMDFAQQLQGNRLNLQRQALQDLMGYSNMLLNQRPYERSLIDKKQKESGLGGWGSIGGGLLGGAAGFALGGPGGAFQGASLGAGIGSGFD